MNLPSLVPICQKLPDRSLHDIPAHVRRTLADSGFGANCAPGSRIAVGVGSRGIANIATIVRAAVDYWKEAGHHPFIFPAMGSHGAATAAGQADVLAHYGIHEATSGCPVVSSLDVVPLGRTGDGIEAFMDRSAWAGDGVMLVGRVKWHTDFAGKLESGLFKMMAIGLGSLRARAGITRLLTDWVSRRSSAPSVVRYWPPAKSSAASRFWRMPGTIRRISKPYAWRTWSGVRRSCWPWQRAGWRVFR